MSRAMARTLTCAGLIGLLLGLVGSVSAQETPEDVIRLQRELIARYVAERARAEVEVAGEMARLKALLERVTNERDAARAKLKESEQR